MKTLDQHIKDSTPKVATIGFFDGVHLGHNYLLEQLKTQAISSQKHSMVVTFANHPRLFFDPDCCLRKLTLSNEKISMLEDQGIDYCLMLQFDAELSRLTSFEFMRLLVEQYGVKILFVGYDHRFGSDRTTTFDQLVAYGDQIGLEVKNCDAFSESDVKVSSSKVRRALEASDIELANKYLGYDYFIKGRVVSGQQIGRQIGFPTANLEVDPLKMLPADGVYAVELSVEGEEYKGVLNIGTRPTLSAKNRSVEVHIINFDGNLYDKEIELRFQRFLRSEQKFPSLDHLKTQIQQDIAAI